MGSRFKGRELGAIEADERGGAEAGAAGGVGCFDVGDFCEIAGCRSAGPNGVISSEAMSGREASACLRAFCCGTFSLWLLSIVLLATKFESPVCEDGLMGSRFKGRELEQSKQTKEGVPKQAPQAGSAVSTLVTSAMASGVDRPTPTAASPQKRRAAERQARVCGPSAARKESTGDAQRCPEGSGLARLRRR